MNEDMNKQINLYWREGNKEEAFGLYFIQLPDWQIYAGKLGEALPKVKALDSMEGFKDILREMICSVK